MKMKKLFVGAFLGMFTLAGVAILPNTTSAQETPKGTDVENGFGQASNYGLMDQDLKYAPDVYGKDEFQQDSLIKTIQRTINLALGILSLVALVLCLWGGFQMMVSGGDSKKYDSGVNLLKWAAIGLAVIAISWLVVSFIFYVINSAVSTNETTI